MKQVSVIISTYTADVSGICSALYELGGMVVIHDPSGCNSTYNTHDEPRWYEQDSLVFISGLSEIDAIMGNDEKVIGDIVRAAKDLSPRFIALVRSPIPMMIGTDFDAIREIIERETGIPTFYFPTNGMHSYVQGVGMALAAVAEHMVETALPSRGTMNLLGVTPLDFSINGTLASMYAFFEKNGYDIISTFAMGSKPEEIARAGEADINVVVSSAGLAAAKVLRERFGTPYVVGMPVKPFTDRLLACMEKTEKDRKNRIAYREKQEEGGQTAPEQTGQIPVGQREQNRQILAGQKEQTGSITDESAKKDGSGICLIGEAVVSQSLAYAMKLRYGSSVRVLCPLEAEEELLAPALCQSVDSEEEVRALVRGATGIIADPMYQPVCPEQTPFFPLPHEAFSGRIYRKQIPDLTDIGFLDAWMKQWSGEEAEDGTEF